MAGLSVIRATHPFDWKKQLKAIVPTTTEISHGGKVYYKSSRVALFLDQPTGLCYYFPDARTIVIDSEEHIRGLIDNGPIAQHACLWLPAWNRVARDLAAIAIDSSDKRLSDIRKSPQDPEIELLFRTKAKLTIGIDASGGFLLQGFASCGTEQSTLDFMKRLDGALAKPRRSLAGKRMTDQASHVMAFGTDLLKDPAIERRGTEMSFSAKAKGSIADFILLLTDQQ